MGLAGRLPVKAFSEAQQSLVQSVIGWLGENCVRGAKSEG